MGRKNFFDAEVGWGQVSNLWVLKISLKNPQVFNFHTSKSKNISLGWVKKTPLNAGSATFLLRVIRMLGFGLGQDPSLVQTLSI